MVIHLPLTEGVFTPNIQIKKFAINPHHRKDAATYKIYCENSFKLIAKLFQDIHKIVNSNYHNKIRI